MNELDKMRETRRWRIWELIGGFLSIFHFRPWRDITMRRKILPRLDHEPPMIGLDRLALEGLPKAETIKESNPEQIQLMLQLMKILAGRDGEISQEEVDFIEHFLDDLLPLQTEPAQRESYSKHFRDIKVESVNIKNSCHLLKVKLNHKLLIKLINSLYKLAYIHGIEHEELYTVDRMGEWLGLPPGDIRRAAFNAQQEGGKSS